MNMKHLAGYVCLAAALAGLFGGIHVAEESVIVGVVGGLVAVLLGGASFRLLTPARNAS